MTNQFSNKVIRTKGHIVPLLCAIGLMCLLPYLVIDAKNNPNFLEGIIGLFLSVSISLGLAYLVTDYTIILTDNAMIIKKWRYKKIVPYTAISSVFIGQEYGNRNLHIVAKEYFDDYLVLNYRKYGLGNMFILADWLAEKCVNASHTFRYQDEDPSVQKWLDKQKGKK